MDTSPTVVLYQPKVAKAVYFPGLNALRYLAAAAVVLCHVEEVKLYLGLPNCYEYYPVHGSGALAVTFFFVLSGFLITYLLLKERDTRPTIEVRSFYIRRALRIWPVYYLISILGLLVLPYCAAFTIPVKSANVFVNYPYNTLLYIFFMPNVALWLNLFVPYASQLWSVGVEEQFYLLWPWLFKLVKRPLPIMLAVVVLFFLARIGFNLIATATPSINHHEMAAKLYRLLNMTRLDCMAIGGIGAYFIYHGHWWFQRYFINRWAEVASLVSILVLFVICAKVVKGDIFYVEYPVYSVCFLVLLVNISCGTQSLFRFESPLWTLLGNISYSVYMYQYLAIGVVLFVFKQLHLLNFAISYTILLHVACQGVTLLLAYVSYRFFESPFLKLKNKYAPVKSTSTPI